MEISWAFKSYSRRLFPSFLCTRNFGTRSFEDSYRKTPRVFIPSSIEMDNFIKLSSESSHYLGTVLRLNEGDVFRGFNPNDGEYLLEISPQSRVRSKGDFFISCQAIRKLTTPIETKLPVVLFFSPIKKTRMKILIEKSVELGIQHLVPVITQNTNTDIGRMDSVRSQIIEAVEQCERLSIPQLYDPISFSSLLGNPRNPLIASSIRLEKLLVCLERSFSVETDDRTPLLQALLNLMPNASQSTSDCSPFGLFCGPEGGFSTSEIQSIRQLPISSESEGNSNVWEFVSLGRNILRSETAVITCLSLVNGVMEARSSASPSL